MPLLKWWCGCLQKEQLEEIQCLDFSHNHLLDVPPDVFQYERTLEELHLNSNRICDLPRQLFYCQELKLLNLNDNEITSIPPAINSLIHLQKLDLSRNMLGTVTDNIKSCKVLKYLDLSMNSLEKLPEAVTSLIGLQELYLNDTMLEFLPANFGRLVNLKILEIRENNLLTLPKSIARLTNLQRIDIGQNEFSELPEVVGQLVSLTELWVDSNRIRRIPTNIGNLKKLIHVDMNNNLLSSLSDEIGQWTQLEELSISGNELESIPQSIGQLKSLVSLKLDENQLQELPESICYCEMLEELMLSHNDLFRLPSSIGLLRRLRILTVDENFLRVLPNELSSCTSLTILSVRGNKLMELPADIGHLVNLRVINIVNNFVTHLPVSLLNLTNLAALWINDNQSQPLVPLQKEYGLNGSIQLTCYMLPQTVNNNQSSVSTPGGSEVVQENNAGGNIVKENRMGTAERKRICFANEVMQNGNSQEEDEDRTVEEVNSERQDLLSGSPSIQSAEPTVRLMRSPTPYPKDLRILAKYVRHGNSGHRNSRSNSGNFEDLSPQKMPSSTPSFETATAICPDSGPFGEATGESNMSQYSTQYTGYAMNPGIIQMPSTTPIVNQIKEARVTSSISSFRQTSELSNTMIPGDYIQMETMESTSAIVTELIENQNNILRSSYETPQPPSHIPISQRPQFPVPMENHNLNTHHLNHSSNQEDFVNNNQKIVEPLPLQPPPYHIAKSYTKKSPEDLMIYDSFRNLRNQSRDLYEQVNSAEPHISMPPPLTTPQSPQIDLSVVNNNEEILTTATPLNGFLDDNTKTRQTEEVPPTTPKSPVTPTVDTNGNNSTDEVDTRSTASQESSPSKVSLRRSDQSWLFGYHKNPRVLQYQIHYNVDSDDVGFTLMELPSEPGIFVKDVSSTSIANLYLKRMDKILDIDGTDFTKLTLQDANRFVEESHSQNSAFNVMISRK